MSRNLIQTVQQARRHHPQSAIILDGLGEDLYEITMYQSGFHHLGIEDVYLTPENGLAVHAHADQVLDPALALSALERHRAAVYSMRGRELTDITPEYVSRHASQTSEVPWRIEVADPLYTYLLGPEWAAKVNNARWMPGTATVRIGAPNRAGARLSIEGWCVPEQLRSGPLHVAISADGISLGEARERDIHFRNDFALPDSFIGKAQLTLTIRAWPIIRVGVTDYGAMFTRFAIVNP